MEQKNTVTHLINTTRRTNGKPLLSRSTALDLAPEKTKPIIDFLKWFSLQYRLTAEINTFVRQNYSDGLLESEYELVASEVFEMFSNNARTASKDNTKPAKTLSSDGQKVRQDSQTHQEKNSQPLAKDSQSSVVACFRQGCLKLFRATSVVNPQVFHGYSQFFLLTRRLRALTQRCVDWCRSSR